MKIGLSPAGKTVGGLSARPIQARVMMVVALLSILTAPVVARNPSMDDQPAPPGRLIDLGGYRLHLWCTGHGSPTVVLSAGAGDFSFDWALVQPGIATLTRVCSYDRSGEAWSDLGPLPRTQKRPSSS